ncbi:hypothetical protein [Marinirhabdus gelatinilytica]|uniref:Uncharacterized protein n=1 Tax=Marinirhabdus gelatinilytica TaxID=1703343 RepID=A0A370QLD1_9FLAO|nr:hypothetical protein [Marinirhabdus gelatinilytica]RDK88810.1 hypothetical protein C8D94_101687 [Marinirhabdus gelatinilytica]
MKSTHTLHTARLNNNCPTCFATNGLELTFTQDKKENKFFEKAEKEIKSTMYCHTCNQTIFPVNWTNDIERVYNYNLKLAEPMSGAVKLKPLFYIIILVDALLLAALIYYFT